MSEKQSTKEKDPNVFGVLKPYGWLMAGLLFVALVSNGLNLLLPKLIAADIDTYTSGHFSYSFAIWEFFLISLGVFLFAYFQSVAQTYASEKIARNLRNSLIDKISRQTYSYIQEVTSSKLLTNLTSDIDAIKLFAGQAVVTIIASVFLVLGGAVFLLTIDWRLGLTVLAILPFIGVAFALVFSRMGPLFKKSQGVIDWLNKIINESILAAPLVRVLYSVKTEEKKFLKANDEALDVGLQVLKLFATIIPIIGLVANFTTLAILLLGGHFVITGSMSLGNFTAFISYLGILIFPIIMIGFMSSTISRASASYSRITQTLHAPEKELNGTLTNDIRGEVAMKDVTLTLGEHSILKNVTLDISAGSRTAILGPTAAGKTHLLYLLIGLLSPTSGTVFYDGRPIDEYEKANLHRQVGFVFQDSIMFNMSVRENIAFSSGVNEADLKRAIDTAELDEFVGNLEKGLDTIVSERGTSLSGGQKQRIMLARALSLNPKVLLLDDFTARVDGPTEQKILGNVMKNYPGITLISVTQKVSSVEKYDQIVLLMEGEVLAKGKHEELMHTSPEYVQIFESQESTNRYELQA